MRFPAYPPAGGDAVLCATEAQRDFLLAKGWHLKPPASAGEPEPAEPGETEIEPSPLADPDSFELDADTEE